MHSDFLQLNTKVDSMRRTLAAVLAKELSPHLRPAHTMAPTPTIVPLITTNVSTSPVASIAANVPTQITASFETSLTTPVATVSMFSSHTASRAPSPTVSVSSSPTVFVSASPTTSVSPSPTVFVSASPTISVSPSPTVLVSASPTNSVSPSPTVLVSASPTISVSPSPIATPSAQSASLQPSQVINEAAIPIGRDITIDLSGQQLMSLPDLTKVFNKSCSRRNMGANLIRALVDKETRKQSNVLGRGKDMLDPVVVSYVRNMCFQFYPLSGSEKEADEWGKCVVSIDESSRRLKNKPPKQKQ